MGDRLTAYWELPEKVKFCTRCVLSNQKPQSVNEYEHRSDSSKDTLPFDEEGVCLACRQMGKVNSQIDWDQREKELLALLDRFRRKDGGYDVLVPGSGGKDSGEPGATASGNPTPVANRTHVAANARTAS